MPLGHPSRTWVGMRFVVKAALLAGCRPGGGVPTTATAVTANAGVTLAAVHQAQGVEYRTGHTSKPPKLKTVAL